MKYRADIDGLRALAVLLVIAYHAAPNVITKGFIGVDIFFVISGYLITLILLIQIQNNKFSLWWFFGRRIKRLFPALILVLLSVLIFGWFSLLAEEYELLGKHTMGGVFFVANFLFAAEVGYFDVAALHKPLLHLWSLAVEEQFYILLPVLLIVFYACRTSILAVLAILFICSFVFSIYEVTSAPGRAFFLPFSRFWELLSGSILAGCKLRWSATLDTMWLRLDAHLANFFKQVGHGAFSSVRFATVVSGIGFLFIASALTLTPDKVAYPGIAALLPVAGAFCIILAGPEATLNRVFLMNRPAVWFGLISYPLYLWHWPILSLMAIVDGDLPNRNARLIAIFSSVLLAWLTYQFVEKRVREHRSLFAVPTVLVAMMLAIGCAGGLVVLSDGYIDRKWLKNELFHTGHMHLLHPEYKTGNTWICPNLANKGANCTSTGTYPSTVVVGDSHALATYAVLRHIYSNRNLNIGLLGVGGCPSLLDVVSHDPGKVDTRQCLQNMDYQLNTILKQEHIKHIVLANRIALYVNGSGFGRSEVGFSGWVFHKKGENNGRAKIDVFFDALRNTVLRAHESGKRVSIVHSTPELGFDIKSCAPLRPYVMSSARTPCAIKRSLFEERTQGYRKRLNRFLREHPEVRSADISRDLCDDKLCYGARNGVMFYVDDDHLSRWGVRHISKGVARQLEEVTNRN